MIVPIHFANQGFGAYIRGGVAKTIIASDDITTSDLVVYDTRGNGDGKTAPNLTGDHENRVTDYTAVIAGMQEQTEPTKRRYIVRRLTPLECCRLQGFPDWWEDGVEGSDSARYKMWGNGIALPCAYDVLHRIKEHIDGEDGDE